MRILHVNLAMGYTEGLNYQENSLSKYHALAGHDVSLLTTPYCFNNGTWGPCTTESNYINQYGVHIIRLPFKYPFPYKLNKQIGCFIGTLEMLEEIEPDIICIHNIQFQDIRVFVKYKKKNLGVKIFVDNHADYSNSARNWFSKNILYRFWWKPCAKAIEKHTEKFFGVMPSRINFLIDVYGISKDKCELLLMGADDEAIKHALNPAVKIAFRKKYGIKKNDLLIITGGKIDAFKSQTLLLMKAIKNINNEHVKLIVFGSVTEELKFSINELCDGNRIQYIGWAQGEQSYDFFASADLVVFPGRHSVYWEQVVGLGIPMICKHWQGTTHVDIGGNVQFIEEDSVEAIQEMIENIINNPNILLEMKQKANKTGKNQFSYRKIAEKAIGH